LIVTSGMAYKNDMVASQIVGRKLGFYLQDHTYNIPGLTGPADKISKRSNCMAATHVQAQFAKKNDSGLELKGPL
jgi:hypothetical protein